MTRHGELIIITLDVGSSVGLEMLDGAAKSAQKLGLNNLPMLAMSAREPSPEDFPEYLTPGTRFFAVRTDADDDVLEIGVSRSSRRRLPMGASCWGSNRTTIDPEQLVTCIDSCIRSGRMYGRRAASSGCWIFRTGDGSATWALFTDMIRSVWPNLDRTRTADQWIEHVIKSARISDDDISRGLPDSATYPGPWLALGSHGLHRSARSEGIRRGRDIDWLTVEGDDGHLVKPHYLVGRFQPCKAKNCSIGRLECKFLGLVEEALSHKADGRQIHAFPGVASQCQEPTKPGNENIQFYPDTD